jgi:hypothetical protein
MITAEFLRYLNEGSDGYISADEVLDRMIVESFLEQVKQQDPSASEEYVENILRFFDILQLNFPGSDSEIESDVPTVDTLEDLAERAEDEWIDFESEFIEVLLNREEEEFPTVIDLLTVNGVLVGVECTEKKKNLENALDVLVDGEEYEKAAEVRDELERIGSEKIKT